MEEEIKGEMDSDERKEEFDKNIYNIYKEEVKEPITNRSEKVEESQNIIIKENGEENKEINEEKKEEIEEEKKEEIIKEEKIDEENTKVNELKSEIEIIKKEKESLIEQNKLLEEKNNKLNEENNNLNSKLKALKESILKLKTCLEKEIYTKLESKTQLLKETLEQKDSLIKQNQSLNEEIKRLKLIEEEFQIYRDKFNSLIKEKANNDNIVIKQEEKIKNCEEEIKVLNEECKLREEKFKKLDNIYLSVIKVIEEHKRTIHNLKNKIKIKEVEENNKKIIIYQKEQEISLLRSFINSYKNDIRVRLKNRIMNTNNDNYNIKKDFPKLKSNKSDLELLHNNKLEQKFYIGNNLTKNRNLPKIDLKNISKRTEEDINSNSNYLKQKIIRSEMDDKDEENIKDISNMMKKMIND